MRYSKRIIAAVNFKFDKLRNDAESELSKRRERLNAQKPRLFEIERELALTTRALLAEVASGGDPQRAAAEGREKSRALFRERGDILMSMGYPEDYLAIKRECDKCDDLGFIGPKMCDCYEKALKDEAHKTFNLAAYMPDAVFDKFDINLYSDKPYKGWEGEPSPRENAEMVLKACKLFVRDFSSSRDNLMLIGKPGTGKTFLSSAVAHALIDEGYDVTYETAGTIFSLLEDIRFGRAGEDDYARADRINESDLLVIDDLGTEFVTPFVKSALFTIVNGRLLTNKKTLINTNCNVDELLALYERRIISRLIGSFRVLELYGKDIRVELRKKTL